jgi:hypothetical protein
MGSLQASEFAGAVDDGTIQLAVALEWHLRSNHYPPHPAFMIPVALRAVELASGDEWDEDIDLPEGVEYKGGTTITVYEAIEAFHLDSFVASDQDF